MGEFVRVFGTNKYAHITGLHPVDSWPVVTRLVAVRLPDGLTMSIQRTERIFGPVVLIGDYVQFVRSGRRVKCHIDDFLRCTEEPRRWDINKFIHPLAAVPHGVIPLRMRTEG